MIDRELAKEFERLKKAYKAHWLVEDTEAFKDFCFKYSNEICKLLNKKVRL